MAKSTKLRDRSKFIIKTEILKPPSDHRDYRVITLPNGLTAMLISEVPYKTDKKTQHFTKQDYVDGMASCALCIGVGSFSDPPELPGFSHFMEHLVCMGSTKYPKENYWDDFISKSRGEYNAWTDCERTCFYFDVQQIKFEQAMRIFSEFFISPLFLKTSVDREIMAVDHESQMHSSDDYQRACSVIAHQIVEKGHPMQKFMTGNRKSLKDDIAKQNINVYKELHSFRRKMYSAPYMTLVVHSMEPLDSIEKQVVNIFTNIPNNNIPRPKFIRPPFQERGFNKVIKIVPNEDIHKMEIIWSFPSLMDHYKARVIEFLSLLLGHSGKESILCCLRKRNLALEMKGGNNMNGFFHNSTWTALIVSIQLTEYGVANYEEVLVVIYEYIALLVKQLPEHVFEEMRHIEETKYFSEYNEQIPVEVDVIAENMHLFPPEHYLCGRTFGFEYNEQLLRECLACLRPCAMLVLLYDKEYKDLYYLQQEPWHNVKYTISDLTPDLIKKLENTSVNPELDVPHKNPYIATNFDLIKTCKTSKNPIVVYDKRGCRMWYKSDKKYKSPNVYLYFKFFSAVTSSSETNITLADVMLTYYLQILTHDLYSATLAGYEYYVEGTPEGIVFTVFGNSEKISLVVEDALTTFMDDQISEEVFNSTVTHLQQVYLNDLMEPVELAKAVRFTLLEKNDPSLIKKYEHIQTVSHEMAVNFVKEFYNSIFIECLAVGNLTPSDAIQIAKKVCKAIKQGMPEVQLPQTIAMELPKGESYCSMTAVNKEDTNSCVVQYFQQGPGTIRNVMLNGILATAMSQPLFNTLRTEKQLGYSVYCSPSNVNDILGFMITVESQANRFKMEEVEGHISKFLDDFVDKMKNMPSQNIMKMIEDQRVLQEYEDADLQEQSLRYWSEIVRQTYVFDRNQRQYAACQKITRDDVINWCNNLVSPEKRKLSIMVEGCSKAECDYSTGDMALGKISKLIQTCIGYPKDAIPNLKQCPNTIINLGEFKEGLKEYPPHKF